MEAGSIWSAGQLALDPVQVSSTSHTSPRSTRGTPSCWAEAVGRAGRARPVCTLPPRRRRRPEARHSVRRRRRSRRPGSRRWTPSQVSATSQTPAAARHSAVLLASAGQASPTPSQVRRGRRRPPTRGTPPCSWRPPDSRRRRRRRLPPGRRRPPRRGTPPCSSRPPDSRRRRRRRSRRGRRHRPTARHTAVLFASAGQRRRRRRRSRPGRRHPPTRGRLRRALRVGRTVVARRRRRSRPGRRRPPTARHSAVLLASAGQASSTPSQVSARSQTPRRRRGTRAVLLASAGQLSPTPSQVSARSQTPPDGAAHRRALRIRRTVVADAVAGLRQVADAGRRAATAAVLFASAGQVSLAPSQVSARSQTPADARHSRAVLLNVQLLVQHDPAVPFSPPWSHCSLLAPQVSMTPLPHRLVTSR